MVNFNKQICTLNYLISRYYLILWHTHHAKSKLVLLIKRNQFFLLISLQRTFKSLLKLLVYGQYCLQVKKKGLS